MVSISWMHAAAHTKSALLKRGNNEGENADGNYQRKSAVGFFLEASKPFRARSAALFLWNDVTA
jgi:hypothetical protein